MWLHFDEVAALQLSIARGDLEGAREAALRVEEVREIPGIPTGWEGEVDQLRRYAAAVRTARTYEVAALAAAHMVASCGSCHMAHDVGPIFTSVPAPPEVGEVEHMVEHVWAADRLWEGLMIPSGERWTAGARVLADHVVPMHLLVRGTSGLGVQLKSLGLDAMQDATLQDRAQRYADILNTCADCHRHSGQGGWGG
ncbi:MAG TPA: hypothetical protein VLA43_01540 [Longimicrobiales bacterium]|nr:hypothetical protein [Longimicrobiales bacterium]